MGIVTIKNLWENRVVYWICHLLVWRKLVVSLCAWSLQWYQWSKADVSASPRSIKYPECPQYTYGWHFNTHRPKDKSIHFDKKKKWLLLSNSFMLYHHNIIVLLSQLFILQLNQQNWLQGLQYCIGYLLIHTTTVLWRSQAKTFVRECLTSIMQLFTKCLINTFHRSKVKD